MSTPFKAWARQYLQLGWSPIPLNLRSKDPVPEGFTGAKAGDRYVTAEDLRSWLAPRAMVKVGNLIYPPGNIAIRLPRDIVGIDVDAHSGKSGSATYKRALKEWGPLPPTWKTSSRPGSPLSGIYLYRVPVGLAWPGNLGKAARAWGTDNEGSGGNAGGGRGGPVTGGVDLIRWDHRYIMVGPSIHDKAPFNEYFWTTPEGQVIRLPWKPEDVEELNLALARAVANDQEPPAFELPSPDEIPDMPEAWIAGLTEGRQWASSGSVGPGGPPDLDAVREWAKARDDRPIGGAYVSGICPTMERVLNKHLAQIRAAGAEGGAHDAARDAVWAVLGDSAAGHYGVGKAINRIRAAFLEALTDAPSGEGGRRTVRRSGGERQATSEFWRILRDGAGKIINEYTDAETGGDTYEEEDPCSQLATAGSGSRARGEGGSDRRGAGSGRKAGGLDEGVGRRGRGSSPFDFERNDKGNAQRLRRHLGGDDLDALWCGPLGGWHLWEPEAGMWLLDPEEICMVAEALDMVTDMRAEADFIEDEKDKAAFLKFVSNSSNLSKITPAIRTLKSLRGVNTPQDRFNANRKALHCLDGVVELTSDGINFREHRREDYATQTTGVRYVPGAEASAWEKFLDKFLPDEADRKWAQKLTGYSLLGGNPQRILVLCKGKTSTGKTTFAEAIRGALGMYGGPLPLSALRDHQDERPRPDLLAVFPRRLVAADEVSDAWELHADMVKRMTGGGVATARGVFGKAYTDLVPLFTPWIATNNTPRIKGVDEATRTRLRVVPFLHKVPSEEQRGRAKEELNAPDVREAILAWAIKGWELYLADETLSDIPPHALELTVEVSDELDELDEFIKEICERGTPSEYHAPAALLYEEYKDWCDKNGITGRDVMSSTKFGRQLTNMGYDRDVIRDPEGGKPIRVRRGIRISAESRAESLR